MSSVSPRKRSFVLVRKSPRECCTFTAVTSFIATWQRGIACKNPARICFRLTAYLKLKICDFGLAREFWNYSDVTYSFQHRRPMPFRWVAPEAYFHQTVSSFLGKVCRFQQPVMFGLTESLCGKFTQELRFRTMASLLLRITSTI